MRINRDRLALELRRARVPFLWYMALLACGSVAAWVIFKNQVYQKPWVDYYDVRAAVDDAKVVVPGKQEVRIAGVKVGVITKSELVGGTPVVTLSLEPRYAPIYRDARLRLRPVTPLQDMYMAVERGTPAAGRLPAGGLIRAEQTVTPVDISRVLQTFDADTRDRLGGLLRQMGPALKDNGGELRAAFAAAAPFLHEAERVTTALADRRVALRRAVTSFARLTGALAARDGQLTRLVRGGDATLAELGSRDRDLSALIADIPPTLANLRSSMQTLGVAQRDLDPALTELRGVADRLEPGMVALERLGRTATPAVRALAPAVNRLVPLARDLRPTAGSLATAFALLREQAPAYDRLTAEVPPCRDAVRDFFSNTPSVTKFGNAFGVYPRGDLTIAPDTAGGRTNTSLRRNPTCTDGSARSGGRK